MKPEVLCATIAGVCLVHSLSPLQARVVAVLAITAGYMYKYMVPQ